VDVCCPHDAACALLSDHPLFRPLRVHELGADFRGYENDDHEAGVRAVLASIAAHASLDGLAFIWARITRVALLDAVVDAALAQRLHTLSLLNCSMTPAWAPALARLLSSGALTALTLLQGVLLDAHAAGVLSAALRANATLLHVALHAVELWQQPALGAAVLSGLTAHPSLRTLHLSKNWNHVDGGTGVAGAALGALVAANAPALTELDVSNCDLTDDGLRPLFEALPANTHLRTLRCLSNGMSAACARDVLLPALRANASLRTLAARDDEADEEEEEEEEEEEDAEEEQALDAALNQAAQLMQERQ
jgi:hypothetical protein